MGRIHFAKRMIVKTEAIVLSVRPFSKTSRMVTWLTRDYGRIVTPVKGACRPKSMFLGQIDVAYRSELLFYERELNGVHNIRETTPLDYREGLRGNWRAAVAADYICAVTGQSVETLHDSVRLYDGLNQALAQLSGGAKTEDVILAYEFLLLEELGLTPGFEHCFSCPYGGERGRRNCRFVISAGKLGCFQQSDFDYGQDTVALVPELLDALRQVQAGVLVSNFPRSTVLGVRRFLGMFMSHHLDISLYARRAAFAWLDEDTPDDDWVY